MEGAKGVLSTFEPKKLIYANFLLDIQPECDCMPGADVPVVQDLGIMMGDDPVAIDQASLDLCNNSTPLPHSLATDLGLKPGSKVLTDLHRPDPQVGLDEAARLGLGSKKYKLNTLD